MKFEETTLFEKIVDNLTDDVTYFCNRNRNNHFDFEDCFAVVVGTVFSDYDRDGGDYLTPPSWELLSRSAHFDSITLFYENCVYQMTAEEVSAIEKMIEV